MRKLFLFMMVSLDGYIEGKDHDLSWHQVDAQFGQFAVEQLQEADTIIMGRKTYQLMESFWPTKQGIEEDPKTAQLMNETPKIVFSTTLTSVTPTDQWRNISLVKENLTQTITELKQQPGKDIIVLGSNNLCVTLLNENVLDEARLMVNPIAIGEGTPLFQGITDRQKMKLEKTKTFDNGNILLFYQPQH